MTTRALVAVSAFSLALAACGSDDSADTADPPDETTDPDAEEEGEAVDELDIDAPVTISYSNFPPTENAESRANAERVADEFMEANPNVTLEGEEVNFDPQTFNAMLAGDTLPIVMRIPLTEMQRIMALGQSKDITDAVAENEVLSSLNPALMEHATDDDGTIFGIPSNAYSLGLTYNRDLFEQAGLDPDDPPQTWDDVRAAAKAISEETGQPGFVMFSTGGQGGWILNGLTYAFGGVTQVEDGESYSVTATNDGTLQALGHLRAMRWEDDSMGSNFLINQDDARDEFAGGRIGMFIGGAASYNDIVVNRGLPPEHYGLASMPQGENGIGTLTGGTIELVRPDVSPEEEYWALKWIEYRELRGRTNQDLAIDNAQARAADELPVGTPTLPLIDRATEEQYLEWIDEYINVNRDNFEPYLSTVDTMPLVPEPPARAQEFYAELDTVVQAVLTEEGADAEQLLEQVETNVNGMIAQDN